MYLDKARCWIEEIIPNNERMSIQPDCTPVRGIDTSPMILAIL